jgi:hypothetical protein
MRRQLIRLQRERVLGALNECFRFSQGEAARNGIADKDHFDVIMPQLAAQLDPIDKTEMFDDVEEAAKFKRREQLKQARSAIIGSTANLLGQHLASVEPFLSYTLGAVVPTLVNLALAANDDTLWKPLHFKVCMKSRSDDWRVRFSALKVLQQCFDCIGEEFLVLLPETIPFLAELLEDENPHVEALCRCVKEQIEELSGEELDPYLNA